jgi:signal transduction histidine kinase
MPQNAAGLDTFLSAAAHDLRDPLHTAIGYLDVLERREAVQKDAAARECLEHARSGLLRMRDSLQSMLAYARAEQPMPLQPVDLDAALSAALADVAAQAERTGLLVHRQKLPIVQGNPDAVRRILQNILSNAMKYSGPASPQVRVLVRPGHGLVRLDVADNGRGIAAEELPRLFQPYRRLASSEGTSGTGLGLALSSRLAQAMGGRLWADSRLGHGTVMHLSLPEALGAPNDRPRDGPLAMPRGARGA